MVLNLLSDDDLSPKSKGRHNKKDKNKDNKDKQNESKVPIINHRFIPIIIPEENLDIRNTGDWKELENHTDSLYDSTYKLIYLPKLTQNGATYTIVKQAIKKGKKILIIAPYYGILYEVRDGVVKDMGVEMGIVPNNDKCKNKKKERNAMLPIYHTPCRSCKLQGKLGCCYCEIVELKDRYKVIGIVWDKFRALIDGSSPCGYMNKELLEMINDVDIILLDEFPKLLLRQSSYIIISELINFKETILDLELPESDDNNNNDNNMYIDISEDENKEFEAHFNRFKEIHPIDTHPKDNKTNNIKNSIIKLIELIESENKKLDESNEDIRTFDNPLLLSLRKSGNQGRDFYLDIYNKLEIMITDIDAVRYNDKLEQKRGIAYKVIKNLSEMLTYERLSIAKTFTKDKDEKNKDKWIETERILFPEDLNLYFDHIVPFIKEFIKIEGKKVFATGIIRIEDILRGVDNTSTDHVVDIIDSQSIDFHYEFLPDVHHTESAHVIVPDTWSFNITRYRREKAAKRWKESNITEYEDDKNRILMEERLDDLCKMILKTYQKRKIRIMVFAFNTEIKDDLIKRMKIWKDKWNIPEQDIVIYEDTGQDERIDHKKIHSLISYYGSSLGAGQRLPYPIKFMVGSPEIPLISNYPQAYQIGIRKGYTREQIYEYSLILRDYAIAERFINHLGRGKHPEGRSPSITFMVGTRKHIIEKYLNIGIGEKYAEIFNITNEMTRNQMKHNFLYYTWLWFVIRGRNQYNKIIDIPLQEMSDLADIVNFIYYRYNKGDNITSVNDIQNSLRLKNEYIKRLMTDYRRVEVGYDTYIDLIPKNIIKAPQSNISFVGKTYDFLKEYSWKVIYMKNDHIGMFDIMQDFKRDLS